MTAKSKQITLRRTKTLRLLKFNEVLVNPFAPSFQKTARLPAFVFTFARFFFLTSFFNLFSFCLSNPIFSFQRLQSARSMGGDRFTGKTSLFTPFLATQSHFKNPISYKTLFLN